MKTFEIMFSDLNEEAQKRFLEFQALDDPEDGNFDIVPITIVELDEGADNEWGQG